MIPETLRRSAETTMHTLVRIVFSKLHLLNPEEEEAKLLAASQDETNEGELRMTVTTDTSAKAPQPVVHIVEASSVEHLPEAPAKQAEKLESDKPVVKGVDTLDPATDVENPPASALQPNRPECE